MKDCYQFRLLDDWRKIARRAWSIRFSLLAALFTVFSNMV